MGEVNNIELAWFLYFTYLLQSEGMNIVRVNETIEVLILLSAVVIVSENRQQKKIGSKRIGSLSR